MMDPVVNSGSRGLSETLRTSSRWLGWLVPGLAVVTSGRPGRWSAAVWLWAACLGSGLIGLGVAYEHVNTALFHLRGEAPVGWWEGSLLGRAAEVGGLPVETLVLWVGALVLHLATHRHALHGSRANDAT